MKKYEKLRTKWRLYVDLRMKMKAKMVAYRKVG